MPTYAELQAETWWGREIIPDPLRGLGARLCTAYGRPITAYGTKGDNLHLSGSHRSQEWIVNSRYCRNRTYTVQSGLTATQARHIAGFDFNPGSTARMIEICTRLDKAVRAGRLEQVLAWYGNDDGDNIVDGYNNVVNQVSTSDASHLWHLHLTLDRKLADNPTAISAVGDVLLNQEDGDMPTADEIADAVAKRMAFVVDETVWAGQGEGRLGHGTYAVGTGARNGWAYSKVNLAEIKAVRAELATVRTAVLGQDVSAAVTKLADQLSKVEAALALAADERVAILTLVQQVGSGEADAAAVVDEIARRLAA
jgi:hypothetical protein